MENSEAKIAEILAGGAYFLKVEVMIKEGRTGSFRILFCTEKPETIQLQSADREHSDPGIQVKLRI